MLAERAKLLLEKLKESGRPTIQQFEKSEEIKPVEGGYAIVTFYRWHGAEIRYGQAHPVTTLPLAFLQPKETIPVRQKSAAIRAERIMFKKNIPTDFNNYSLFYDEKGKQFACQSDEEDLSQFIKKNPGRFSLDEVKEMIGQVLLAVYDNHSNHQAHRDLKPENFLVFFRNGKYQIKLTDHRNSIEVRENGKPEEELLNIAGSEPFHSPELKKIFLKINTSRDEIKKVVKERNAALDEIKKVIKERNAALNFLANDCYSLGRTIFEMGDLLPENLRNNPEFTRVYTLLTKNVARRITIYEAITQTLFGKNPKKREAFFAKLRAQAKAANLKIDGYDQAPVDLDDPFYFLDRAIKPLYCVAKRSVNIAEQIEECKRMIGEGCVQGEFSEIVQRFDRLKRDTSHLARTPVTHPNYEQELILLKEAATTETKQVLFGLFRDRKAMATLLKKAVAEAYQDYVKINNLEDKKGEPIVQPFFALHTQLGREQAKEFQARVAEVAIEAGPKVIFDLIHTHYHDGGGNKRNRSFKTILANKLEQWSNKSIDEWKLYFDKFDAIARPITA